MPTYCVDYEMSGTFEVNCASAEEAERIFLQDMGLLLFPIPYGNLENFPPYLNAAPPAPTEEDRYGDLQQQTEHEMNDTDLREQGP